MSEKCPHCGGNLIEVGSMKSGNSEYDLFECEACYKEVTKCVGLTTQKVYS